MNRILIIIIILLSFGCKSERNNSLSEFKSETIKSTVLLDTLVFDKGMTGEVLNEKHDFGSKELQYYKQFISAKKINEKQIIVDDEDGIKTEIVYLGPLLDLDKHNTYHVIRDFKILGIGEMQSPRGVSNIAFIYSNFEKVMIYRMGLPNELPVKIEDNILYFNLKSQKVGISILGGLPPMLCLPEIGCN